jgi:hypothetical protein
MKLSFRQTLADSHVSAVAIAVLLFRSFEWTIEGLSEPFSRLLKFLVTAVAIFDIPFVSPTHGIWDRHMLVNSCFFFSYAITSVAAAWLLSRWVYKEGPIRSLSKYRGRLARSSHV